MKITREAAAASYLNKVNIDVKNRQSASVNETGRNFDRLMISANSRKAAEEQLASAAKKDVSSAVFQQASADKVGALKEQVAQGTYQIDPDAIAGKIMFFGGDQ